MTIPIRHRHITPLIKDGEKVICYISLIIEYIEKMMKKKKRVVNVINEREKKMIYEMEHMMFRKTEDLCNCREEMMEKGKGNNSEDGDGVRLRLFEEVVKEMKVFNDVYMNMNKGGKVMCMNGEKWGLVDVYFLPYVVYMSNYLNCEGLYEHFRLLNIAKYEKENYDKLFKVINKDMLQKCQERGKKNLKKEFVRKFTDIGGGRNVINKNLTIKKYILEIEPDMKSFTFKGLVKIEFQVNEPTNKVVLNSKELEYESCQVDFSSKEDKNIIMKPVLTTVNSDKQLVTFYFDKEIEENGTIIIKYSGIINNQMFGFYRSKYTTKEGKVKYIGTTQLEPHGARQVLPSIDEPGAKAVFKVILILNDGMNGISNMNIVKTTEDNNQKKKVEFADSPVMSTYLLAFCVFEGNDYDFVEGVTTNGLIVRIWTLNKEGGEFALHAAKEVIPMYEEYYEEKFPLPKLDLIGIGEFAWGAMENWGLIICREVDLMINESSSITQKRRVLTIVTHEIAHMWWNDLWLNEGFATWCQYYFGDKIHPEYEMNQEYIKFGLVRAFNSDQIESSHAVDVNVTDASQVDEIFDAISYLKGCAVIRMIIEYLGIEVFRKGVCKYLKKFKYLNTTTKDLWDCLSEVSGKEVASIGYSWVRTVGHPVIICEKLEEKKYGKSFYKLTQKRFLTSGKSDDKSKWIIPLTYITDKHPDNVEKLLMNNETIILSLSEAVEYIKINPGISGFYRVKYNDYEPIIKAIETCKLSAVDRFSIQNDVVDLCKSGEVDICTCLKILKSYINKNEKSYLVFQGLSTSLKKINTIIEYDEEVRKEFKKFSISVFESLKGMKYKMKIGVSDHDLKSVSFSTLLYENLLHYEDEQSIEEAKGFLTNLDGFIPDLRPSIFKVFVKHLGKDGYEAVKKIFETTTSAEVRVKCLQALGLSKDEKLVKEALDYMLSDKVKKQDKWYLFGSICGCYESNVIGRTIGYEWMKKNLDYLVKELTTGGFVVDFVCFASINFDTLEAANEVEEFFSKNPLKSCEMSIKQVVEKIRIKAKWKKRVRDDLLKWLRENNDIKK